MGAAPSLPGRLLHDHLRRGGRVAYTKLGREEDPAFAVNTMLVMTSWPGATTVDMMQQVTDRIERKLEETPKLDYTKSYTTPGVSVVYVNVLDSTPASELPGIWYQVRKKVADIRQTLPTGVVGPFFNDEFGDVYGVIYGLTYDGFTERETRDFAETARSAFLNEEDVAKVILFGTQDEKILSDDLAQEAGGAGAEREPGAAGDRRSERGDPGRRDLDQQGGHPRPGQRRAHHGRQPEADQPLSQQALLSADDLATITKGYVDPPQKMFRVNGKPAIGIGISMRSGGNILRMGEELRKIAAGLRQRFPIGIDVDLVSDQPKVVEESIHSFTKALVEAVVIVLAVSFVSLGVRAGLVVALSIPLVLSIVFLGMSMMDISLQRISLGALIISLGLLVDDAMITVEMMVAKIEEGFEKAKAATFAYTSVAFSMLTGTLVTALGFLPIGFARSGVGQYCFSLFMVILIALLISWIVASSSPR
jgi:Cation/multidrug efflux pump